MGQAVVTQMIAEGAFGQPAVWIDGAGNAKVSLGINGKARRAPDHRNPPTSERTCQRQLGEPLGQGHDRRDHHGRR